MFRRLRALMSVFTALCLFSSIPARSQTPAGFIRVYQVNMVDTNGTPVSNSTVCAQVIVGGVAGSVQVGGGGTSTFSQVCTAVTAGAWSMPLPDMSLTTPKYPCIALTATNDITGNGVIGAGFACIQPRSIPPPNVNSSDYWCGSGACDVDKLPPYYPANVAMVTPPGTPGCTVGNGSCNTVVTVAPTGSQTVTQPVGTDLNIVTSGAGSLKSNGQPVAVQSGTVNVSPTATQTVNQPAGTTLKINSLNGLSAPDYASFSKQPQFNWLRSLSNSGNQQTVVQIFSDSYSICDPPLCATGPPATDRWPEQFRANLQNTYGYAGTGIMPLKYSIGTADLNTENYPTATGSWDTNTIALGPNGGTAATNTLVHFASGSSVTFQPGSNFSTAGTQQLVYDTLVIYCMTTNTSGSMSVSIDGAAPSGTYCNVPTGNNTAHAVQIPVGALKTHKVVVSFTGDNYVYAMQGMASTNGISVSNMALGGATSAYWNNPNAFAFSDLEPGPHALSLIMLQTNDYLQNVLPSTTSANIQAIVSHQLAIGPNPPSVGLVIPPVNGGPGTYPIAQYTAAETAVAAANPIDLLNIQWRWGTSFQLASGLWSPDTIHPNGPGSLDEAQEIFTKFVPGVVFRGSTPQNATCIGPGYSAFECALVGLVPGPTGGLSNKVVIGPYQTDGLQIDGNGNVTIDGVLRAANLNPQTTPVTFSSVASGVTVTCVSNACSSASGALRVASTSFTSGQIAILAWPATAQSPNTCLVTQDGGTSWYGFGQGANPTMTGFPLTNANTIAGATVVVKYDCY